MQTELGPYMHMSTPMQTLETERLSPLTSYS